MLANPGRQSQDQSRGRDDKRIRNAQEAKPKDTYYRPEYGWVMSDAQVAEEQKIKGEYDKATADATARVGELEKDFQASVAKGRGEIEAAYSEAAAQNNVEMVPVRVVNGNTIEATYMLPKSTVDKMNTESFNKGKGSYTGAYVGDGKYYNVDVRATGVGVMGQPLHDSLREASIADEKARAAANKALTKEKAATISGFEAASAKNFAGAQEVWNKELETISGAYGKRVATGKAQYDESKKKYSDSVTGVDLGLLESPTGKVNPNAKGTR